MAFTIQTILATFISLCLISSFLIFVNGDGFAPALGTWYGDPNGAGSGGACGWGDDVTSPPFSAMIAAGNSRIFMQGRGCGECYQLKCNRKPYCSGYPVTVTITDECPGACNNVPFHFDLSGHAFGAMANPGQAANLRNLGQVDIQFQRVPCNYGATNIAFKIDSGTNPNWFAVRIEFAEGDGALQSVEIAPSGTRNFIPMKNLWGEVWFANINPSFSGPFSFRLTSPVNQVVVARNVVPSGYALGKTYYSNVNF
ncbi:expansin-B15-like [Bidens hawaiensis]|uniref:expansin-B15-like n=1 Tax=Bidens hawaiensis TaxID=980011 RepID=UPI00404B92E2